MNLTITPKGTEALAKNDEFKAVNEKPAPDVEQIQKRLDMLDRRLDNVDSIVTAVAERIMNQPITLNVNCPKCGRNIEIAIIGTVKPGR